MVMQACKQDENQEAILNFAKYKFASEDSITMKTCQVWLIRQLKSSSNVPCKFTIVGVQNRAMKKQLKNSKKVLILRVVDNKWTDHIDALDSICNVVGTSRLYSEQPFVA